MDGWMNVPLYLCASLGDSDSVAPGWQLGLSYLLSPP